MKKVSGIALALSLIMALSACGGQPTSSGDESGEQVVEFKFVANKQEDLLTDILYEMADLIEEKSDGTLKPDLYLEGQLGSNDEDYCTGLAEASCIAHYKQA